MSSMNETHHKGLGYVAWIFGFMGAHRFYYGKPGTGLLWMFTGGLFLIGWIVDLFLIPRMNDEANAKYQSGPTDFSVAWLLLSFLGVLGVHRMYMGKVASGVLYLLTFGGLFIGVIYDFCTLNSQVDMANRIELRKHGGSAQQQPKDSDQPLNERSEQSRRIKRAKRRVKDIANRVDDMERYVTSRRYNLDRQFAKLDS